MLNVLVSGKVVKSPKTGVSAKGTPWTSVSLRCPVQAQKAEDEDNILANVIAFGDTAEKLGRLGVGEGVSVSGEARFNHWEDRDGGQRTGLSVTASEVLTAYSVKKKRGDSESPKPKQTPYAKRDSHDDDGFDDVASF